MREKNNNIASLSILHFLSDFSPEWNNFIRYFLIKIGDLWEEVNGLAISQIIDHPPDCFYDLAVSPGK